MRRLKLAGILLVGLGTGFVGAARSGAQVELGGFVAAAVADDGRFTFSVPGFAIVEEVIDGGGATSQSVLDPQSARSFASLPYPGETVLAGPGLFNAATGQPAPGGYPFVVSASHPTAPEETLSDPSGAYQLAAQAGLGQASALARLAGQGGDGASEASGGTRSDTSAVVGGDTVTVVAETVNEALNFGDGALRIASVRSRATTVYTAGDPEPKSTTELVVTGGSAGGNTFGFGPEGLVAAGQGVPIPVSNGLDQLNTALEPAGIHLAFAGGQQLAGGAAAGALEIRLHGQAPVPGLPPGVVHARFGQAAAVISMGEAVPGILPPVDDVVSKPAVAPPPPVENPPPPVESVEPLPTAGLDAGVSPVPSRLPFRPASPAGPTPESIPASASPTGFPAEAAQPIFVPRDLESEGFIFGTLIAGGLVMLALSSLWRGKGVLPG